MARDWRWRKASFDGIPFYVDVQEIHTARRLVVHEYPGSEVHDLEDMGRCASRLEVTAYFVSESADIDSAALRLRLQTPGPGLLSIPMFGTMMVRAMTGRPNWNRQALNYVGFSVTFIEEGTANAPVPIGLGVEILAGMGAALGATLGDAITATLVGQPQSGYVRSDMASQVAALGAQVETLRQATPLDDATSSAVKTAVSDAVLSLSNGPSVDPGAVAAALFEQADAIVANAAGNAPATALADASAASLAAYSAALAHWGVSPMVSIAPLSAAVFFTAQASRALAIPAYASRVDALAARAMIGSLIDGMTPYYGALGADAASAFDVMYGQAAQFLSSQIANLAPVVIVESGVSLPSNVLAYRLYGDPSRGMELVNRNKVATPCFMPRVFEAAAS